MAFGGFIMEPSTSVGRSRRKRTMWPCQYGQHSQAGWTPGRRARSRGLWL